jgi:hypothetical protein
MTEAQEAHALDLFGALMADISQIALGKCCNSDAGVIAGQAQPRMVSGFEPPAITALTKYEGYY